MICSVHTLTYRSSNRIDTVAATVWLPEPGPVRGIIQICHGMCEYIDRYDHFARYLVSNGFAVCGNDHLGHGRTAGNEDKLGYFAPDQGPEHLINDMHKLRTLIQKDFPSLPYFLLGHSMGSFLSRYYITKYTQGLSGFICCGTSGPNPMTGIGLRVAGYLIKKHGDHYRSNLLQSLAFKNYNRKFGRSAARFAWISRDEEVSSAYEQNSFCNFTFTTGGFRDLFTLLNRVSDSKWSDQVNKYLPVLIISGDMDPVGNFGKGVDRVYQSLIDSGVHDLKFKLYLGARHELINETCKTRVYADILYWMNRRM